MVVSWLILTQVRGGEEEGEVGGGLGAGDGGDGGGGGGLGDGGLDCGDGMGSSVQPAATSEAMPPGASSTAKGIQI